MDFISISRVVIIIYALGFLAYLAKDCIAHKEEITSKGNVANYSLLGFVLNVLDTLGIGNMATSMAWFKFTKSCKDEYLCGTGNVAFTLTTIAEYILFLDLVEVEMVTLVSMIAASVAGAVVGASVVTKWPVNLIRKVLGVALLCVAIIMACRTLHLGPFGSLGTATELAGIWLIAGIIGNFALGMLMTMGIGLYAPCIALVSLLGMNVAVAFPIMMGSCAFLMPASSWKFIKEGKYNRKATLWITVFGIPGVLFAYYVIKSIPLSTLIWVVVCVMIYTSYTFFRDAARHKEDACIEALSSKQIN